MGSGVLKRNVPTFMFKRSIPVRVGCLPAALLTLHWRAQCPDRRHRVPEESLDSRPALLELVALRRPQGRGACVAERSGGSRCSPTPEADGLAVSPSARDACTRVARTNASWSPHSRTVQGAVGQGGIATDVGDPIAEVGCRQTRYHQRSTRSRRPTPARAGHYRTNDLTENGAGAKSQPRAWTPWGHSAASLETKCGVESSITNSRDPHHSASRSR